MGVDACLGKWVGIALDDGRYAGVRLDSSVASLATAWPETVAIAVDIPIGFPEFPLREAERAAREFLGVRRSSVFPTFPAVVLSSATYEEAKAVCVERGWPKLSLQSFGMRHRIREVTEVAAEDERIIEVHPEVSFRELFGRDLESKRTALGAAERRAALKDADIELPDLPYPLADVLDAAVAAWSAARYARQEALPLPKAHEARLGAIWR